MSNIIGFSHLVFTVNNSCSLSASSFLNEFYFEREYFELDHGTCRLPMIREITNSVSKISLYKSKLGDLPGIELLHVKSVVKRPLLNYGLICQGRFTPSFALPLKRQHFGGGEFYVDYYYDELLNSLIAPATNLFNNEKDGGCWMILSDFEKQKEFFLSIGGRKVLIDTENIFAVKCRVINKKLSSFVFVLIKDITNKNTHYNDDLGLSTLGWFARNIDETDIQDELLSSSDLFSISLNGNCFDAKFFYNNQNISHEILKVN